MSEARLSEENYYHAVFKNAGVGITRVDLNGVLVDVNQKFCEMLGYSREELLGKALREVTHPDDYTHGAGFRSQLKEGVRRSATGEKRFLRKDGALIWARRTMSIARDDSGDAQYVISIVEDITERKLVEQRQAIEHAVTLLLANARSTREAMPQVIQIMCNSLGYVYGARWVIESNKSALHATESWCVPDLALEEFRAMSTGRIETLGKPGGLNRQVWATTTPVWMVDVAQEPTLARREAALRAGLRSAFGFPILVGGGFYGVMEFFARETRPRDERVLQIAHTIGNQIGQFIARNQAEGALRESEARFRSLTELSSDWYWEEDENHRFTEMSRGICHCLGVASEDFIGKSRWDGPAIGLSEVEWAAHRATLKARQPFHDLEYGRAAADGQVRYLSSSGQPVFAENGEFKGYRGVGKDITARKMAEAALRKAHDDLARQAQELTRSNAELQQFAYVASHDLQEPLRMISSYTQLIVRRYGDHLDSDAREFMDFIVDGAIRMKQLIEDLLGYSRIGTRGKEFQPTNCETVLQKALVNLRATVEHSSAVITHDPLPSVNADDTQLTQLFQNLIANAMKFQGADAPSIRVSARANGESWNFSVKDNGIGIDPQYFGRIFLMFQRLHSKAEYPGTGIGLAICKKVVDRHGGRIWVESQLGRGSTFFFTLPMQKEVRP